MAKTRFRNVKIHDFRVLDQTLYESDPEADNIVYMRTSDSVAHPFTVARRVSGPSGWYTDTCRVLAAGRFKVADWDSTFELEGESVDRWIVETKRGMPLPGQGPYTLQYLVFGEPAVSIDFQVVAADPPTFTPVVPGPVDAALAKGTIAWLALSQTTKPIWYGYEGGRVYVLTGEGEQQIPGLGAASRAHLLVRSKGKQSLVGDMACSVSRMEKGPDWDAIARDVLVGRRLNLTDGEGALDRWRATAEIYVLTPVPTEE